MIDTYHTQNKGKRNLVIDWGNSSLKTAWFDDDSLVQTGRYSTWEDLLNALDKQTVGHVLVSSTSRPADEIRAQLMPITTNFLVLDSQTFVPIRNAYDTPTTLGADRLAAAVGATALFPGQPCLVLDLGTCLTADFVDQQAVFQGGLISPGVRMRFRSMHEQTARLPLVETPVEWPVLQTKNTRQAMQSGVLNGLLFEMNGIIETYRQEYPNIVVLACGGDMPAFESRLKPPIFAVPELVLIGLNRILRYNVDNLQANTPDITT
ncbi:type III pantothenate kinase [Spirosoma validum]|uniref:Type III pantothenate kinase n=1 Tax=Spirosoma validum TaxID=2771355 RepID=A0A927GF21_9BACT|nr:type III pantothenate kinase [Spirosoma validum]MBD2755394.1 type III pantothenate kinase [Spirosoma validum]